MSKVTEKPAVESHRKIEAKSGAPVREHRPLEKEMKRPPAVPKPTPFYRWMGWVVGLVIVAGVAGLVWWGVSLIDGGEANVVANNFTSARPPASAELVAPPLNMIDPHESPEIMRIADLVIVPATGMNGFSGQTRALLEANDGIDDFFGPSVDGWSLQTRKLLEWNSGGIDPFSLQTRILLEANDGIDN